MSQSPTPSFRVEGVDGVTVFSSLVPSLTHELDDELKALAVLLAGTPEPRRAVLDLSGVEQINSTALAVLINFQRAIRDAGGSLKVCGADAHVMKVFRLTKLDAVLDILDTRDAAFASYRDDGPPGHGAGGESGGFFSRLFGSD